MGAGWSAANGLHLQCHKDEYVCGDTVRAIVALNVVTPLELEGIEVQVCRATAQPHALPHWSVGLLRLEPQGPQQGATA